MARIALTGATGFVGGTVASVLADQGHDVVCLVRRQPATGFPWPALRVDMSDVGALSRALDGADAVVHLAIMNGLTAMYADRRAAHDGYVGLTRRIVDAANATGVLVGYVSTDWVFDGTTHLADETEPPNPVNLYGFLKAASEIVVLDRARRGFVARVGGVQGIHQTNPLASRSQDIGFGYFSLAIVDAISNGQRFCIWADPDINTVATPIVSAEIGALLGRAIECNAQGILHFAGGTPVNRRELALATCRAFDLDSDYLDFGLAPETARVRATVPFDTSLKGDSTMQVLGTTAHSIDEQLRALRTELVTGRPAPLS